jgi:ADP-ribosylation factor-like protein 4
VFVLDSVDSERMEEAKLELARTAKSPDNAGVPILVLANKQDLPGAKSPEEIEKALGLLELGQQNHFYHVQPACAIIGDGLDEGLDTLYEMIVKKRKLAKQTKGKKR